MSKESHGTRACYKAGCGCDLCKRAESEYRRELRRGKREEVGSFAATDVPGLKLVSPGDSMAPTSGNAALSPANYAGGAVEEAVRSEIATLTNPRPGLVAGAIAMARILDNPKAVSSQPPAMAKLVDVLERLRKGTDGKRSKLASVRAMTSIKATT